MGRQGEEKSQDKKRSTSGHSSSHSSTQRGPSQSSERAPSSQERSQDKTVSNHEKVSLHRPGPASVSRGANGERLASAGQPQVPSQVPTSQTALADQSQQQASLQPSSAEKEHKKEKHKQ